MYQALYRKYRPSNFSDVVGQEHITSILKNQLKSGKIFHAYLFTGPRGTGKTSCAKILAKAVNCLESVNGDACCECESCRAIENGEVLDITEIDAASNNGVENIRDLKEQVSYTPSSSKYRVYIIDEVHMLSIGAFNALLKTLEEPPSHIVFILATTEVHKLPATILSRCQRFDFHRISNKTISNRLTEIAALEGFSIEPAAANMIAALCDGGMRDALSTLDLCAARTSNITEEDVMQVCALAGDDYCVELSSMINSSDCGGALKKIDELHKNAVDLQRLCNELINHYRNLMIAKSVKDPGSLIVCAPKVLEKIVLQADGYAIEGIVNAINVLTNALDRMTMSDRRTELETAIVKLCTPELNGSVDALLDRVERIERQFKYLMSGQIAVLPANQNEAEQSAEEHETSKPSETTKEQVNLDQSFEEVAPQNEEEALATEDLPKEADSLGNSEFAPWQDVVAELKKGAPLIAATLSGSKAFLKDDVLLIDCENEQFFSLMRNENPIYREQIKAAVQTVVGRKYRLGPYKKSVDVPTDPLQNIIHRLKELEVPKDND